VARRLPWAPSVCSSTAIVNEYQRPLLLTPSSPFELTFGVMSLPVEIAANSTSAQAGCARRAAML
jgi:hypothetical protein